MSKKIIITIPAYNEEKTLPKVLREIKGVMAKHKRYKYTLLVVDDGSKDRTVEVAKKGGAVVFSHRRNRGLAETFRTEMQQCIKRGADIIVHTDADGQYDSRFIPKLIKKVEDGYDLVLGSRFAGKIESMPFMKRMGNNAFSVTLSHLTGVKLTDTTTGFRAFTRDVAENISFINTFTYTQEQLIKAAKQKYRIAEIPVIARKTRESRLFKGPFQYAWRAWINILRIYRDYDPLKFFGKIASFLFLVGFACGLVVLYTLVTTGSNPRGGLTMLSALFILTSVQVFLFGFLADMRRN
jgi:glycosyltransferase involved in cell wall biosynthesis